jgi:hypothetical protein
MIRRMILAAVGAALIGVTACGPAAADSVYHEHHETDRYTIDISYPLDFPDRGPVSDFVSGERARFLDWLARFDTPGRRYTLDIDAKTYRSTQPNTTSLVLTIDNDTGFAHEGHPATAFKSFTTDPATQSPVTLGTLFSSVPGVIAALTPRVRESYDAPSLELLPSDCENLAVTDDAVTFFFGEGQLIPNDNTGPRVITVPRTELAPLIA